MTNLSRASASFAVAIAMYTGQATPASAHAAPSATLHIGTLTIEKYGAGEPALILVPGLACASWVWESTIDAFVADHSVYAVSAAGFSGATPDPTTPVLDGMDAALQQLIVQEHLVKPVVIGHSLGGFMAIRFAEEHSDELSAAVALDGLPVFPTMAQESAADRKTQADQFAAQIASESPAQFAKSQAAYIESMVTDPKKAAAVAARTGQSDPGTVARAMGEMLQADLRPELPKITIPLLELTPTAQNPQFTPAQTVAFYTALLAGAPHVTVTGIADSLH